MASFWSPSCLGFQARQLCTAITMIELLLLEHLSEKYINMLPRPRHLQSFLLIC